MHMSCYLPCPPSGCVSEKADTHDSAAWDYFLKPSFAMMARYLSVSFLAR